MAKTALYPGADRTQRYWPSGGGILQSNLDKLVLHSTETPGSASCPGYSDGRTAPSMTINPWPGYQRRWQHFRSVAMSAKALRDTGGFAENRDGVLQFEIVGYSDKASAAKYGFYLPNLPAEGIAYIAESIAWAHNEWGIPLTTGGLTWKHYPASYGAGNKVRLSVAQFDKFAGILGHQHVPDSTHGDPDIDIDALLAAARALVAGVPADPKPVDTQIIPPTLRLGSKGSNVLKLQKALAKLGFKVAADGIFGPKTQRVVKAFQRTKGLQTDGVAGPLTWKALLR